MKHLTKISAVNAILIFLLLFSQSCGDKNSASGNFQGTLTYVQNVQVSKAFLDMGMTREMVLDKMKQQGAWSDTIKISYNQAGDYRISLQNEKQSYKIYRADSNKIYIFNEGKNSEQCTLVEAVDFDMSGAVDTPEITSIDTAVAIGGVNCSVLRIQWKLGRIDYYYDSTQMRIDPAIFTRHSSEGWSGFLNKSKSLPFGIRKDVMGMSMVQTLTASKAEEVSPDLFAVPALISDETLNPMKIPGIKVKRVRK